MLFGPEEGFQAKGQRWITRSCPFFLCYTEMIQSRLSFACIRSLLRSHGIYCLFGE